MADDVLEQVLETAHEELEEVLETARILLAQPARGQRKHDRADEENEQGVDHVIRHVDAEGVTPEIVIHRAVQNRMFVFHSE